MSSGRILVAEDDRNIREGLLDTLRSEGYEAVPANDGNEALALFRQRKFDLVLLDIMMPGRDGFDVCRELRARDEQVPVIMLTAKGEEIDKVVGLRIGADDYVTKPFGVRELLARIAAALRRTRRTGAGKRGGGGQGPDRFRFGAAEIDARRYKARLGRKAHDLTDRELRLLRYFQAHPGEVLSRDELLNEIWGIDYYGTTRTLDQHIARLRRKVTAGRGAGPIATVHGVGYRYEGAPGLKEPGR